MITDHKYTTALLAAIDASKTIMDIYENEFDTIIKADGSPLTKADLALYSGHSQTPRTT